MSYTAGTENTMSIPIEPAVLSCYVPNSAAETNIVVNIPWKECRLAYAYAVCLTAVDTAGAMEIDLELNAASGTEMMSISMAAAAAAGDQAEGTITTPAACKSLDRTDGDRDAICIEVDGSAGATGAVMLYMYFEGEFLQ